MKVANNPKIINIPKSNVSEPQMRSISQCPHGCMPGACPVCSRGGGGGGGGKVKEMSWNEGYALWTAYLSGLKRQFLNKEFLNKTAMLDHENHVLNLNNNQQNFLQKLFNNISVMNFGNLLSFSTSIKNIITKNLDKIVTDVKNTISNINNKLQQTLGALTAQINQLASVIGEKIKSVEEFVVKHAKKIMEVLFNKQYFTKLNTMLANITKSFFEYMGKNLVDFKNKIFMLKNLIPKFKKSKKKKKRND